MELPLERRVHVSAIRYIVPRKFRREAENGTFFLVFFSQPLEKSAGEGELNSRVFRGSVVPRFDSRGRTVATSVRPSALSH